jgi:hypothetical protein
MKTASKAFMSGAFGTLGACTAIIGTAVILVLVGERKVKRMFTEYEEFMRSATETILGMDPPPDVAAKK